MFLKPVARPRLVIKMFNFSFTFISSFIKNIISKNTQRFNGMPILYNIFYLKGEGEENLCLSGNIR